MSKEKIEIKKYTIKKKRCMLSSFIGHHLPF